jgi:hypothetical protein
MQVKNLGVSCGKAVWEENFTFAHPLRHQAGQGMQGYFANKEILTEKFK